MQRMASSSALALLVFAVLVFHQSGVTGSASDHKYKEGDEVPLYANKVGPFNNPSETYRYFDLPFCPPDSLSEKREDLGEVLNGDRMVHARYKLNFRRDKEAESLCEKVLKKEDLQKFRMAVKNDYYFQMYYDDLPIWGFIGKAKEDNKFSLFTHVHFDITYNGDRVIEINVSTDPKYAKDISDDTEQKVEFTYSAKWKAVETPFDRRMEKYSKYSFLPQHLEIHWFSIINSCVTVLLLTGFLATILMRVLKNDFIKYSRDEESPDD